MGSELRVGSFSVRTMGVNGPDSVWMRAVRSGGLYGAVMQRHACFQQFELDL